MINSSRPAPDLDGTDAEDLIPTVAVHVGITCAEAVVFHIPAVLYLPAELAAGLEDAARTGRADNWDEDSHPAMAWLWEWLEDNREAWEDQLDMGVHTQDGEDLEIRNFEVI
ncbi:hypothetical protein ACEZDB_32510 [Streptacidiphilus sp. N1-3]|uniref:Uncharacterized protein n=1 Tax=Streptacidiphilus alkalitolerans TaxID=3342712 RepID=A0ABV6XBQ1_9ACTN